MNNNKDKLEETDEANEQIEEINVRPRQEKVPYGFLHSGNYVFEQGLIDNTHAEKVEYSNDNRKILTMARHQMRAKFSGITAV